MSSEDQKNIYLQHEVQSATPARLRWMLIRRADELCAVVEELWKSNTPQQADQWLLRIREILGELLAGVSRGDDPVRSSISDLYVFMIQMVTQLEKNKDPKTLADLRNILAIELETWNQVIEKQGTGEAGSEQPRIPAMQAEGTYEPLSLEV